MVVASQGKWADTLPSIVRGVTPSTLQQPTPNVVKFDPKKHLSHIFPGQLITMKDLGFPEDTGVSSLAVSHPFQLFTQEAIDVMRAEIFQDHVRANCTFSSNIAACQIRGYAKE
jgi:hypothetical protein